MSFFNDVSTGIREAYWGDSPEQVAKNVKTDVLRIQKDVKDSGKYLMYFVIGIGAILVLEILK